MEQFLKSVEKRAFRMTEYAVKNREDALDIVQNAMLKLVQRYSRRPDHEWPLLFHRILQNGIRDWQRKTAFRNKFSSWFSQSDGEDVYATETLIDTRQQTNPSKVLDNTNTNDKIHQAIAQLPLRQQQVFLLRNWQGLNVKQTAKAMSCSEGSVKTHLSRAVKSLQQQLQSELL